MVASVYIYIYVCVCIKRERREGGGGSVSFRLNLCGVLSGRMSGKRIESEQAGIVWHKVYTYLTGSRIL
jgi:hypothetical protein